MLTNSYRSPVVSKRTTALKRRVNAAMKARGFQSQNALARKAGIGTGYLSMILAGKRHPRYPLAVTLEELTGIEATAFLEQVSA